MQPVGLGFASGDRRAVAGEAGWARLRSRSCWPAQMRPTAIASMMVIAMMTRRRVLVSSRMPGRSNPKPPANRLFEVVPKNWTGA